MSHSQTPNPQIPDSQEHLGQSPAPSPEHLEHASERRRILRSGAQVLAAAGSLLLARPLLSRSAFAQDAMPGAGTTGAGTPGTSTSGTTTTCDPMPDAMPDGAMPGAMPGEPGAMMGDQAQMQANKTGTEKANAMQPLAPADAEMNRAPIGSMSGPQGIPATAQVRQTAKPGKAEENDAAILNFALTLEYLEAEFYTRAVEADEARAFLRGRPKDLARALMRDEVTHVETVTDAIRKLGGTPVEKPTFQFPAEAFVSQIAFLQLAAQLEETGVSAYSGQAPNVRRRDVLNFAASIYGIEARHTGLIRFYLGDSFAPRDKELPLSVEQILQRARPFIVT